MRFSETNGTGRSSWMAPGLQGDDYCLDEPRDGHGHGRVRGVHLECGSWFFCSSLGASLGEIREFSCRCSGDAKRVYF